MQQKTFELIDHLQNNSSLDGWRIPEWLPEYGQQILDNLHPPEIIGAYTLYHDCGKPFCRVVDKDGKVHFPNHADVSRQTYLSATGDPVVASLIGWDMYIHTASADEIAVRLKSVWTRQDALTLLLAALAEVHSNAILFGGMQSTSFKAKFKTVERRGKQICKFLFER